MKISVLPSVPDIGKEINNTQKGNIIAQNENQSQTNFAANNATEFFEAETYVANLVPFLGTQAEEGLESSIIPNFAVAEEGIEEIFDPFEDNSPWFCEPDPELPELEDLSAENYKYKTAATTGEDGQGEDEGKQPESIKSSKRESEVYAEELEYVAFKGNDNVISIIGLFKEFLNKIKGKVPIL